MGIKFPFLLETERLALRSPTVEDAPALKAAIRESMHSLRPWMFWAQEIPTLERMIENCRHAEQEFVKNSNHRIHIFLKESNELIGFTGLHRINWKVPSFEIGYWLRQSRTGQGLMTEAVRGLTNYCLEKLAAKRVEIRASSENVKSRKVAERAGFELEGILRNDRRHVNGTLRNTVVYALIPKE